MSNTLSTSLEQSRENEKLASFLEKLKTNPDQLHNSAIKKEYLELLSVAFEKAKKDAFWARYVIPELLKL